MSATTLTSPTSNRSRFERAPTPTDPAVGAAIREAATRGTLAVGLGGNAVLHAVDAVGKWSETRYMFWMYMALILGCFVLSAAVLFQRSRATFLAASGLAATVMIGFIVNRTVGMPQAMDDIGNWTEPLGLASLVVEGMVLTVGLGGFLAARRG